MSCAYKFCPCCATKLEMRLLGGLPRQACPVATCGFIHWDNPAPVVAALVEHDGLIVLARNQIWPAGTFGLITGFLERAETPEQAVIREVKEELNLEGQIERLIGVYTFAPKHEIVMAYHVIAEGEIRLNEELAEFRLIAPEKLRAWEDGTGMAVRDWLKWRTLPST